ncbi:fatty acid oxidation complex subunit alpha FadJ [Candidatus Uabimicrobium amorphum]|uniref:enoyl-CoA hydratase n=1 Tax=Uabimicrobium amorphum TaxID=2596890 RepID=A0A5S9IHR0_UABAM|nr:fatty acid oxidation complex subunit alpha FadJ [Candidatus Uabimicrobium amorphum]BBM81706.1 crotonase [Candidatus Uabimicrobium amorphum]
MSNAESKDVILQKDDGVALLWLDRQGEKVNTLSVKTLDSFSKLLDELEKDPEVKAVVLISKKKDNFIVGADLDVLQTFDKAEDAQKASQDGNDLLTRVSKFPKPFVAAINGTTMGGGLEVALACHYRIVTDHPKTVLALPEVKLGLLPGGGGTQRLPRLIGIQKALGLMLTGRNVYPHKAKKIGLADEIIHPHGLLQAAKNVALKLTKKPHKRKKRMGFMEKALESTPLTKNIIYNTAKKQVMRQTYGNYPAPLKIIDCVKRGMGTNLKSGLQIESKNFGELVVSPESTQLVNLFFAMTDSKKNPQQDKVKKVEKIGMLGAGLMGAGIANISATKDIRVVLKDISMEAANNGFKNISKDIGVKCKKRIYTAFQKDTILSKVFPTDSYKSLRNTDVVIEAVFEDLDLKRKVLAETEAVVRDDCIFASNTSSLPITDIAAEAKHPERVIGMHYFSPVPKMPLLEIITTDKTADWVTATAYDLGVKQGKTVIVVGDGPGFYTTRILAPLMNEAICLLEEGAKIEDIDRNMKLFGYPVGPITLLDEVGLDVAAHVTDVMNDLFSKRGVTGSNVAKQITDAGLKGRKNGKGFYLYPKKKGKKKTINTDIYRFFGGNSRKTFDREEMQLRVALMMVNEAAVCLQDGILKSPRDGDLGAILGLGFPPFRGGPFRYIDTLGASKVVATLESLQEKHGVRFTPAPILQEYAKNNKKFYN